MGQTCQYIDNNQSEKSPLLQRGDFRVKKGFTLIEIMVVVLIFSFLFAGILTVLTNSDRSWRVGQNKLIEQQQLRRAMDDISYLMRQTNAAWPDGHRVVISEGNTRVDFYNPVFDAQGQIASRKKITYELDPNDLTRLLKKEGTADSVVVATDIQSINFQGGCANCASYTCTTVDPTCPVIKIQLSSLKQSGFNLSSQISFRNKTTVLPGGTTIEEPAEGEF